MKLPRLALLALPLTAASCSHMVLAVNNDGCDYEEPREASISTAGASNVRIKAQAGSLTILGKADVTTAAAHGTACAESNSALQGIQLIAERRGDTIWIESVFDENYRGNRTLSFTVELPNSLPLEVTDGSGGLEIHDVASLKLDDGSGGALIRGVNGDLVVDDGSGGLEIEKVVGSVRIHDGSGSLSLRDVQGPVDIVDSSGNLEIEQIRGAVVVKDGSGGMSISQVIGNVRISDGSGGITVNDVQGDLIIPNAGSGGVDYANVSGRVDIPKR